MVSGNWMDQMPMSILEPEVPPEAAKVSRALRNSNPQLSLGYEPYDERLCRLGPSPVATLTSANLRREVVLVRLRLPRLSLSRSVRFTNRFTEPVSD
jgi:hypothetical protein